MCGQGPADTVVCWDTTSDSATFLVGSTAVIIDIMTKVLGVSWFVVDTVLNGITTGICGHIQVHMMSIWLLLLYPLKCFR